MRRLKPLIVSLAAATLALAPISFGALPIPLAAQTATAAEASVNVSVFFDKLAPHGQWVKNAKYRYVFCPKVDADWRPYTHGHWIYLKDYGWYFASKEPFAWALYHYGRWFVDQRLGWCWVPGNAWAGAWVSWRRGNDYVGWAPLQPSRDGFAVDVDFAPAEPPHHDWVFVPTKKFLQPSLEVEISFGDRQPDAFDKTEFVGPVVVQNNIVVNNVIDVNFIQQQTNTTVVVVNPQPVNDPQQVAADANGPNIAVFAPQIPPPKQDEAPQQAVDESQAQPGPAATDQPSSEQPSSEAPSSQQASSAASSSEASKSASKPTEASSGAAPSSAPSDAPSESREQPAASSAAAGLTSSAAPSTSSSISAEPASSSAPAADVSSSATAPESSEAAPASSSESAADASAVASSSTTADPSPTAAPTECDPGLQLVDGKCVPMEPSAQ